MYSLKDFSMEILSGFCPANFGVLSIVWCSAADTHLKLLERAVSGARLLTMSVFECDTAHRRAVSVLCMLDKIRCNPIHHPYGALPMQ